MHADVNSPDGPLDFLQLHDAIAADIRITVVTPNRRLATSLKREYDDAQRRAGRRTWESADVLPLETFIERTYRSICVRSNGPAMPRLLTAIQCQYLWEDLIRKTEFREGLLSVSQAAKQAMTAWRVANSWQLLPALRGFALHGDAKIFMTWVRQYLQVCRERNLVDASRLPDTLSALLGDSGSGHAMALLPSQLVTLGFDIVTPQLRSFLDMCTTAGVDVRSANLGAPPQRVSLQRVEFASDGGELHACAAWARRQLEMNPAARIGIVVPELRARRNQVVRALTDALLPLERAQVRDHHEHSRHLFNVSLGEPLADYALVRDALALIDFALGNALTFAATSALLRSPFIAGADDERASRAMLDVTLRETAAPEMSLFSLQKKLKLPATAGLAAAIARCGGLCARLEQVASLGATPGRAGGGRAPRSPREWRQHFTEILGAWGFPGDARLSSVEFQVFDKLRNALEQLATLQSLQPRMSSGDALSQLRRILADTVFQPESAAGIEPPIQVLGILESAGQRFDALWVTGLHDDAWPLASRPAPFIPAVLQRSAGVTEASAIASLALDRRITDGWCASAAVVVFSHAGHETTNTTDPARGASALIREIPLSSIADAPGNEAPTDFARALQAVGAREPIPDRAITTLPAQTRVRGGSSVLRDQAACPFRAFARHRLRANGLESPHAGLDAAERGTLLHRALSLVWGEIGTHANLVSLDGGDRAALVRDAVTRAIADARAGGIAHLAGRFAEIEQARLVRTLDDWLDYECLRAPFEVVARECKRSVEVSGLMMNLRLDRLDRLADGAHALIDYKTGNAKLAGWLGNRPDEPQLPLYFVTSEEAVSALAFAKLKRGTTDKPFAFEGVSATENLLPDVTPIERKHGMAKKGYVSWDVLVQEWKETLAALAEEFARGAAQVDPKNAGSTCAQCDLHSLCRIAESAGYATLEEALPAPSIGNGDGLDE